MFDKEPVQSFYDGFARKVGVARMALGHPLTLAEKIIYAHLYDPGCIRPLLRGSDYALLKPDRAAMQDATAQMALLQFMNAGKEKVAVPSTVHCDHLICAHLGEEKDLPEALKSNSEVYEFLSSAAARYGIGFWKPGAGIIHQIILENYAFPGGMMVGTDSHTPNAGGLGMFAVGVGGADAVDVMTGMEWELKMPKIIGVRLSGHLSGWASPKDIILKLAGMLTTKGATNAVIEYFGPGASTLSATGKATCCNMGAEVGATTSLFPFDEGMSAYLTATGRGFVARKALENASSLRADDEVLSDPQSWYDEVIDMDLTTVGPRYNGPFTPDASCAARDMKDRVSSKGFPDSVEASLIGSCTNSSYQDLARAASVARQALDAGLSPASGLIVNPGSMMIKATAERDGILDTLRQAGAIIMANACGPCIGQWKRITDNPEKSNSIVTTFNRNFAKRADGNPNTNAFIVSPEMAVASAFSGKLGFDPESDSIGDFKFGVPEGNALPEGGFAECERGYVAPAAGSPDPVIREGSERIQRLKPFPAWDGNDFIGLPLLIKTAGKCTTDHISMAGPWLRFRGHLENISENMLMGAVDAFSGKTGPLAPLARRYRDEGTGSIVVAEDNYGEGSSREHAAMEPRFLGVKAIIAKSFARIHETNLKKQGVLALTFADPSDYDKVLEGDRIDILCSTISPGKSVTVRLHHADGSIGEVIVNHTYNKQQIRWFKAGSALNDSAALSKSI